jgi:hypothetical protein
MASSYYRVKQEVMRIQLFLTAREPQKKKKSFTLRGDAGIHPPLTPGTVS